MTLYLDASNPPQTFGVDSLKSINGVKFTPRELDVIAYLLSGKTIKTIAAFLSISPKTADTHIRNIMLKAECNSREAIINFTEKSHTFSLFRKRYQDLLLQAKFEEQLQKVSALVRKKGITCHIVDKRQDKSQKELLERLIRGLEHAGIQVMDSQGLQKLGHTIVISDMVQEGFRNKPYIVFNARENYYLSVFEVLKALLPTVDANRLAAVFKSHDEVIPYEHANIWTHIEERLQQRTIFSGSWTKKNQLIAAVVLCFIILCILILFFANHKVSNASPNMQLSKKSVRSDLLVPTDTALLKRPGLIKQLGEKLKGEGEIQRVALIGIVGIGGAGKTTLARQFGRSLDSLIVWEINAETKDSMINSFKDLAYALAQTKDQKDELVFIQKIQNADIKEKQVISFVKRGLKENENWLLIYDNVDNFSEIKNYFPQDAKVWGMGKVIITTRDANIKNTSYIKPENVIEVEELTEGEALTLFSQILYESNPEKLVPDQKEKTITFLKNIPPFPLDVSTAAYYIKSSQITYEQYLERIGHFSELFEKIRESLLKETSSYTKTRYGIITSSLQKVIEANPDFKDLLLFICLLDSQNIPKELLKIHPSDSKSPITDAFLYHLKKYSLVTSESSKTFSLHRSAQTLGQAFLMGQFSEDDGRRLMDKISALLKFYYDLHSERKRKNIILLIPHLEALLKNLKMMNLQKKSKERYEQNLSLLAGYAHKEHSGNILLAEKYLSEVYALQNTTQFLPNNIVAELLLDLGEIYACLYDYEKSLICCQKSIKLCQKIPDSETLMVKNLRVMAFLHHLTSNFEGAKECLEKALNKNSALSAKLKAEVYAELASLYSAQYLHKKEGHIAENYVLKALETINASGLFSNNLKWQQKKSLYYVAKYKEILCRVYSRLGRYNDALIQIKEVERIIEHSLDAHSQAFLGTQILFNKGEIMLRDGHLNDAENCLSESIRIRENLMGSADTLKARIYRAEVRIRLRKFDEAYEDCNFVFKIGQKIKNHYYDLIHLKCFYHAAVIKYRQGDLEKSFEHFADFFKGMKDFCRSFLDEKECKDLEGKGVFLNLSYNKDRAKTDSIQCLNQSATIFSAIYGAAHPFVRDYVLKNVVL